MLPDPRGLDTGSADPRFGSGSGSGSGQIRAGSANTTFPLLKETDLPGRKRISTRPTPRARIQKTFSWVLGFFYSFIFFIICSCIKRRPTIRIGEAEVLYQTIERLSEIFRSFNQRNQMHGKCMVVIFKIGLRI
jgi:hypothetical protein